MHDDEFPSIIGSGTEHHVSVSERTGNAKTPQNNVTSHEEDIQARQHAFEAQEITALEQKKAVADALAEHTVHASPQAASADANIQKIATDKAQANRQTIDQAPPTENVQGIATDAATPNHQKIEKLGVQVNRQAIEGNAPGPNRQSLSQDPGMAPNNQAVGVDGPTSNRQVALENASPAANRQSVGNGKIQSHFEVLPSEAVERNKVVLASGVGQRSSAKPAAKLAPATRAAITAQELEEAKRQRDKLNDAFHGRIAGIKHDVEALNDRLTDIEEQAQNEDSKLIKGNPNDFKVDLD